MSDVKISALPSATIPLAGTEVLPIVQSSTTVKASIANVQSAPVAAGTANGVQYLNGSKVPTTGSLLTTNGSNLVVGGNAPTAGIPLTVNAASGDNTNMSFQQNSIDKWYIRNITTSDEFSIYSVAGAYESLRLKSTGVTVSTGNLIIGTSGNGIDFSATPGTGTSELLADYEEGTWTPTISGSTTAGSGTYTVQVGRYTKVGNLVTVTGVITWTAHTGTGSIFLTGLPFTSANIVNFEPVISVTPSNIALTALNVASGYVPRGDTFAVLTQYPTGGGAIALVPMDTDASIQYTVTYQA